MRKEYEARVKWISENGMEFEWSEAAGGSFFFHKVGTLCDSDIILVIGYKVTFKA